MLNNFFTRSFGLREAFLASNQYFVDSLLYERMADLYEKMDMTAGVEIFREKAEKQQALIDVGQLNPP